MRDHRPDVEPIDPIALPGVESVERQGAPPRSAPEAPCRPACQPTPWAARRPCSGRPRPTAPGRCTIPKADNYSLRLVAGRRLYDAGCSVTGSPSLTPLVPALVARANPYDLDRLGAVTGDRVKVRSARGELILAAEADEGVPRGVVAWTSTCPAARARTPNAVATLIDSRQPVTDVRLESV